MTRVSVACVNIYKFLYNDISTLIYNTWFSLKIFHFVRE
jgi:hypothetical protein